MAVVSCEFPIDGVFELAGPLVTARCTSVCRTWRAAAEQLHVWRVHVENMCGRAVATALDKLRREGRTTLTFKELIIKRWRSGYTWTQVVPPGLAQNARNARKEQLAKRLRFVLLEASLVHRQTSARMDFVTVPMDDSHIRRLFTNSGVPSETSGVSFPSFALSEVESINDCSIVLTLYDLAEARVAKIMTAQFMEPLLQRGRTTALGASFHTTWRPWWATWPGRKAPQHALCRTSLRKYCHMWLPMKYFR